MCHARALSPSGHVTSVALSPSAPPGLSGTAEASYVLAADAYFVIVLTVQSTVRKLDLVGSAFCAAQIISG